MNRAISKIVRIVAQNPSLRSSITREVPRLRCFTTLRARVMYNPATTLVQTKTDPLVVRRLSSEIDIKDEIDHIVKSNKVVLFMKGVPEAPKCGFSNAVCQILRMHGVAYESHDILEDESLRQGIKEYSNWPTIPQVFINGQFVGGCDVLLQLHQSGDLIEELEKAGIKSALVENDKP